MDSQSDQIGDEGQESQKNIAWDQHGPSIDSAGRWLEQAGAMLQVLDLDQLAELFHQVATELSSRNGTVPP